MLKIEPATTLIEEYSFRVVDCIIDLCKFEDEDVALYLGIEMVRFIGRFGSRLTSWDDEWLGAGRVREYLIDGLKKFSRKDFGEVGGGWSSWCMNSLVKAAKDNQGWAKNLDKLIEWSNERQKTHRVFLIKEN
jgi:hypothetical protein